MGWKSSTKFTNVWFYRDYHSTPKVSLLNAENLFFQKGEPKRLIYRDYTYFSKDSFLTYLSISIDNSESYEAFETKTVEILDKHAPRKKNSKKEPETSSFQETKKINNEKISVKKYCEQDE